MNYKSMLCAILTLYKAGIIGRVTQSPLKSAIGRRYFRRCHSFPLVKLIDCPNYIYSTGYTETPKFLFNIGLGEDPLSHRCKTPLADMIHMMWACSNLIRFLKGVIDIINNDAEDLITTNPRTNVISALVK